MTQRGVLTEIEDEALAASEGDYVDTPFIVRVLRTWHRRAIASKTIDRAFQRLIKLGLVNAYTYSRRTKRYARSDGDQSIGKRLYYRATREGEKYLAITKKGA